MKSLKCKLMGFPAISELNLIQRVCAAHNDAQGKAIRKKFPKIFSWLGNLGEEYKIS